MRFEMFTEHEVELFALHINFLNLNEFFLSICMQHTDKNVQIKWFFGGIFWYCVLQDRWSFRGLRPLDPTKALLWTHWGGGGLIASPDNQLQSVSWILAEFCYNRSPQGPYTGTCTILQETINGFLCPLIVFRKM